MFAGPDSAPAECAVGDLIPDPRNARTSEAPDRSAQSIDQECGFTNPILADPEGHIIAGHGRLQAARAMGCCASARNGCWRTDHCPGKQWPPRWAMRTRRASAAPAGAGFQQSGHLASDAVANQRPAQPLKAATLWRLDAAEWAPSTAPITDMYRSKPSPLWLC